MAVKSATRKRFSAWKQKQGLSGKPSASPRRILMTTDTVGGVWNYSLELARGLAKYDVEVALATMGPLPTQEQRRQASHIHNITLHESGFRLEWMEDPWEDVEKCGEWLMRLDNELKPDLVHLNGYSHADLPWSCPCMVVAHSCVLSWWRAVKKEPLPRRLDHYKERVARGLARADLVAAPSMAMLKAVEGSYLPLANTRVIYNGRCRKRYRPDNKINFILSVGRIWDEAKNIGAVAGLAPALPWPVFVAGEEKHPEGAASLLDNVSHLGNLPPAKLAPWFASAAIYALPARYEPFGLTVLEAALSGCALVLGDIPSLRELWEGAAVFVPPDDTDALADVLQSLCDDRDLRERMAEKAFERSRFFNPNKMAAEYFAAYMSLNSLNSDLRGQGADEAVNFGG
ncbi:glycosyltransferase family 4 protein [Geotalea sp. SG265]|uniref:glycosyltransferase family 4 protein n=1 Tax=Geotalea sp. SG265 TaxID=2922867 RepID=UPI001FAF323A|nr:glycosyltransferase family 4 protein [Geotalea sp. SG265]